MARPVGYCSCSERCDSSSSTGSPHTTLGALTRLCRCVRGKPASLLGTTTYTYSFQTLLVSPVSHCSAASLKSDFSFYLCWKSAALSARELPVASKVGQRFYPTCTCRIRKDTLLAVCFRCRTHQSYLVRDSLLFGVSH